jgi:hypothetical protein
MPVRLILGVFTEKDKTFQVVRFFSTPLTHSVYFMDHDSEGRCYCKWLLPSPQTLV